MPLRHAPRSLGLGLRKRDFVADLLRHPRSFWRLARRLPFTERGRTFVPAGAPSDALSEGAAAPNAFRTYMETHVEGAGIWKWRHYADVYQRVLGPFIGRAPRLVEVGVFGGGSLGMWQQVLGAGTEVHGVDIDPACRRHARPGVTIHVGDQADLAFWRAFKAAVPPVDIFIDDGGHRVGQQVVTFEAMLPHLAPGGIYLCEDIHGTSNAFAAYIAGVMDQLHGMSRPHAMEQPVNPLQRLVRSVHVYPFLVVVETHGETPATLTSERRGTEWPDRAGSGTGDRP